MIPYCRETSTKHNGSVLIFIKFSTRQTLVVRRLCSANLCTLSILTFSWVQTLINCQWALSNYLSFFFFFVHSNFMRIINLEAYFILLLKSKIQKSCVKISRYEIMFIVLKATAQNHLVQLCTFPGLLWARWRHNLQKQNEWLQSLANVPHIQENFFFYQVM